MKLNLLITTYIESEYVQIIRDTDSKINVIYRPDIIHIPRFPSDHTGIPQQENLKNNKEWKKKIDKQISLKKLQNNIINILWEFKKF